MARKVTTQELADRLDNVASNIDKLVNVLTASAIADVPAQPTAEVNNPAPSKTVKDEIDPAYLAHMSQKAEAHAKAKGEDVVLYARKNKQGQLKLAYAMAQRFADQIQRQPSCRGAIQTFKS